MAWNDSFDAMVLADLDSSFFGTSEFADSVVVYQRDQAPRTIICRVVDGQNAMVEGHEHQEFIGNIEISTYADAVTGIINPQIGDYIIWETETFNFLAAKTSDLGMCVYTFQNVSITRQGTSKPPTL